MRQHGSPSQGHHTPQLPPPSVGGIMENTDSPPPDNRSHAPVSNNGGPEVSVLPLRTPYINLEQLADRAQVCESVGSEWHDILLMIYRS